MNNTKAEIRDEVRQLAEEAFHLKLISGYGDGPDSREYQIVCDGKPKHFELEEAYFFLRALMKQWQR